MHRDDDGTGSIGEDRDVRFTSGGVDVAASFRAPVAGAPPVPAAVLVAGSGPVDRDGNTAVAPYADVRFDCLRWLADRCAAAGIASLRYDKLGVGATGPAPFGSPTLAAMDFDAASVQPVRDALAFLADQPVVDADRLLVVGHSEGGGIALAVGTGPGAAPPPAALALIEPMYERPLTTLARQLRDQVVAAGLDPTVTDGLVAWIEAGVAEIRDGTPPFGPPPPWPFPDADGFLAQAQTVIAGAVYERFRNRLGRTEDLLDPPALARRITVPTFVSAGGKDFNTPVRESGGAGGGDAGESRAGVAALADAFEPDLVELVVIPGMHHTLRDIGDADALLPDAEAVTHPFSDHLAEAFDGWLRRTFHTDPSGHR